MTGVMLDLVPEKDAKKMYAETLVLVGLFLDGADCITGKVN